MVTKQDLLDALEAEVHTMGTPVLIPNPDMLAEGFKLYSVIFYEDRGNVLVRANAQFIVKAEGETCEEAYYFNGAPTTVSTFVDTVIASAQFKNVLGAVISNGVDWVLVEGYSDNGDNTVTKKQWIIRDDPEGGVSICEVTNP